LVAKIKNSRLIFLLVSRSSQRRALLPRGRDPQPAVDHALGVLRAVLIQLLDGGIAALLMLPGGPRVRLIPVLEAWARLPLELPGVGRAGVDRGPGLDGPRATLSIHHRARLGRHRLDLDGVIRWLRSTTPPTAPPGRAG
jgi:hypothetical protein